MVGTTGGVSAIGLVAALGIGVVFETLVAGIRTVGVADSTAVEAGVVGSAEERAIWVAGATSGRGEGEVMTDGAVDEGEGCDGDGVEASVRPTMPTVPPTARTPAARPTAIFRPTVQLRRPGARNVGEMSVAGLAGRAEGDPLLRRMVSLSEPGGLKSYLTRRRSWVGGVTHREVLSDQTTAIPCSVTTMASAAQETPELPSARTRDRYRATVMTEVTGVGRRAMTPSER